MEYVKTGFLVLSLFLSFPAVAQTAETTPLLNEPEGISSATAVQTADETEIPAATDERLLVTEPKQTSGIAFPWELAWGFSLEGIFKFVDGGIDFNPLFLYNDRMLNRNNVKIDFSGRPKNNYRFGVYGYFDFHLRNQYESENALGSLLFRYRVGIGTDHAIFFGSHLSLILGFEYRFDYSIAFGEELSSSTKHRTAFSLGLEGSGAPGLAWEIEQKVMPFFTVDDRGFSYLESESVFYVEYEVSRKGEVRLYNDFYADYSIFPKSDFENLLNPEVYIEETVGFKTGVKDKMDFFFGPTYFFHNVDDFRNVSLAGFKSGIEVSLRSLVLRTSRASALWTLSASYWGAYNFDSKSYDHLLQLALVYKGSLKSDK